MDPIKPNEAKQNTDIENIETPNSFEETKFNEESFNIEAKPAQVETGFNTDKAFTPQKPNTQAQNLIQDDQTVTNSTPSLQTNTSTDSISSDALIEQIIRLDRSTNKPGKKAREELFKKAAKSQV